MMELKVDRPALAGQNIDPNTFQRVWDRVMPGQARGDISIPDTAVPAVPTETPAGERPPAGQGLPSVPGCPAQETPPVPDCPAQEMSPVPDCPAQEMPPVPGCPQESRPETPGRPACPACPGTAPAPEGPALCLGEASQGDSGTLERLMTLAVEGARAGRALARRSSGSCARALSALAQDHRSAFRRLSAAYFLITGKRYSPKCPELKLPSSLPLALRRQFVWEQQWERNNNQAAQAAADPCLRELYLELAQEGALHAGIIRSLLEQMG